MKKMPRMLRVEWYDAYSQLEPEPTPADIACVITTLGWEMEEHSNELYLAYAQDYNQKLDVFQGITYVPRGMIKKTEYLFVRGVG